MKWEGLIFPLRQLTQIMPAQEQSQSQPLAKTESPGVGSEDSAGKEGLAGAKTAGEQATAEAGTKIPAIRTLKGDISDYIKAKDLSLAEIAAASTNRRRFEEKTTIDKNIYFLAGIILAVASGLAIAGWFVFFRPADVKEAALQPPKPLVFSEKQEKIIISSESRLELTNAIQNSLKSPIAINTILDTPILLGTAESKNFINALQFFNILKISPPADFIQSLEGPFTLGVFYFRKNAPFLLFKIRSFDLAFGGMLEWEKNIYQDLKEILLIPSSPASGQKFQDKIIANHDSRVLYDGSGAPVVIYGFIGKRNLVITPDTDTLEEIFQRLGSSEN